MMHHLLFCLLFICGTHGRLLLGGMILNFEKPMENMEELSAQIIEQTGYMYASYDEINLRHATTHDLVITLPSQYFKNIQINERLFAFLIKVILKDYIGASVNQRIKTIRILASRINEKHWEGLGLALVMMMDQTPTVSAKCLISDKTISRYSRSNGMIFYLSDSNEDEDTNSYEHGVSDEVLEESEEDSEHEKVKSTESLDEFSTLSLQAHHIDMQPKLGAN